MIVQCEACQTRFRLADEKIKPGGTKVRCSKCKEIFTVSLPEPEPEPEPVAEPAEETVDFGSFNMEKVTEDTSSDLAPSSESPQSETPEPGEQTAPPESDDTLAAAEQSESSELDFSSLESEMASDTRLGEELAEEFSVVDTSQPATDDSAEERSAAASDFSLDEEPQDDSFKEESTDFAAAFEETEEPGGPVEFDFSDETDEGSSASESAEIDFSAEGSEEGTAEASEFSFDSSEDETPDQEPPGEFAFDDEGDDTAFNFDDDKSAAEPAASEEYSEPGEFSFDDESFSDGDSASEWGDDSTGDDASFDFDEPSFASDDSPAVEPAASPESGELQFGEIDFSSESGEEAAPSFQSDDDFSKVSMESKEEESESFSPSQQHEPPPARDYDDNEPLPVPQVKKKSSLSRILLLLILLLLILGGAAGYLFMQEGTLNLNTVTKYLPFLQEYIGEPQATLPGDRIAINISGTSYVETQAGQLLVIQGAAINNHPTTRSAITIKGVLLDDKGNPLLQQTVFCGNQLDDDALASMTFAAIEEAMNNQFGEGLSNMNVAPAAAIPFTIVFRNLPDGIANINVEVVDSKPGAG